MNEQPTGDYRLVPWAYPPIPGGADNSTAQDGPYDFSQLRVDYRGSPVVSAAGAGQHVVVNIQIQDYVLNDSSNVSQILWKFTPEDFVNSAGSVFTGQIPTQDGAWTPEQFNTGSLSIMSGSNWVLNGGTSAGQCQRADATFSISVVDAQGVVIQTATSELSI